MAKVFGPLLSRMAHGSIGDTLIYLAFPISSEIWERCKVHMVVQKYHQPTGGDSPAQAKWKDTFKEVANAWKELTPEQKETWRIMGKDIYKRDVCTAVGAAALMYEMYMSFNLFGKAMGWAISKTAPRYATWEWAWWFKKYGDRQLTAKWRLATRIIDAGIHGKRFYFRP